jgi:sulfide:quinone oxidoreductase
MATTATTQENCDVLIIGGGAAGIATAASLLKRRPGMSVSIVEPSATHDYQPGWTFVGNGIFTPEQTRRATLDLIPQGVKWLHTTATQFDPENNEVMLADGRVVRYRILVVATGVKLDWDAIPGLRESLGKHGVTSNYDYRTAPYTWQLVRALKRGTALFTQPPLPIKCAGAPQKAMYLSASHWHDTGCLNDISIEFHNAGDALFGVKEYIPALMEYVERYHANLCFRSKLVAVDGPARTATFEVSAADGSVTQQVREFDMLHVVPPQKPVDAVSNSPLAGTGGWVDVDSATLCHSRYANVFALGDVAGTTNAKTAAAVRKQAPVVAVNVAAQLDDRPLCAQYDGYGACPLTVERGKIVLAEFTYGGKLSPTLPTWLLDGTRPTRLAWFLKEDIIPMFYWDLMLKGREWLCAPAALDQNQAST